MAKITTVEEALAAVREDGEALKDVPWGRLNLTVPAMAEICLAAVKQQSGNAYFAENRGYVPPEKFAFNHVPDKLKTAGPTAAPKEFGEICLLAVKQKANPEAFSRVPEGSRTEEMCLEAVKRDGAALKDVPERLKTAELCLLAVKNLISPPPHLYPEWDRFSNVPEGLREEVRRRYESGE